MAVEIKLLRHSDAQAFAQVARDLFDEAVSGHLTREFLEDPRHHIAAAFDDGLMVGFVSAIHYVHPDKPSELWINEVAVAASHQKRGIGKAVLDTMLEHARDIGCKEAWVLTDRDNVAAMKLYASAQGAEHPRNVVMFTFRLK